MGPNTRSAREFIVYTIMFHYAVLGSILALICEEIEMHDEVDVLEVTHLIDGCGEPISILSRCLEFLENCIRDGKSLDTLAPLREELQRPDEDRDVHLN